MQNQHPRVPVSFLPPPRPPRKLATWIRGLFKPPPPRRLPSRVHGVCVFSSSPTKSGDCTAFQKHQELQIQECIIAGVSLPASSTPALPSLISQPAQAPGMDISPFQSPLRKTVDSSLRFFLFPSLFYLGVLLICSVASVSQCWVLITCAYTHPSSFLNSEPG